MTLAARPCVSSLALAVVSACPDCPPARDARALVFSDGFWLNAWYALLPFVVVAIAVRWFVGRVDRGVRDE
jgi:hypothetical protein